MLAEARAGAAAERERAMAVLRQRHEQEVVEVSWAVLIGLHAVSMLGLQQWQSGDTV